MLGEIQEKIGKQINGKVSFSRLKNCNANLTSSYYSVKYIFKGTEVYEKNNSSYELYNGELLFVRPNEYVQLNFDGSEYSHGICLYLDLDFLQEKNFSGELEKHVPSFKISTIDTELGIFYSTISNRLDTDTALLSFVDVLKKFLLKRQLQLGDLACKKWETKLDLWEQIEQSKSYILTNYSKPITLKDISNSAYMSPYHFQRTFSQFFKMSPAQYLLSVRMRKAWKYHSEGIEISQIAEACGFEDPKYFKKVFKKYFVNYLVKLKK
ncbi:MAG: AraC family transcriptional regulator [Bacteroidota bacterium]